MQDCRAGAVFPFLELRMQREAGEQFRRLIMIVDDLVDDRHIGVEELAFHIVDAIQNAIEQANHFDSTTANDAWIDDLPIGVQQRTKLVSDFFAEATTGADRFFLGADEELMLPAVLLDERKRIAFEGDVGNIGDKNMLVVDLFEIVANEAMAIVQNREFARLGAGKLDAIGGGLLDATLR